MAEDGFDEYLRTTETQIVDRENGFIAHLAWLPIRTVSGFILEEFLPADVENHEGFVETLKFWWPDLVEHPEFQFAEEVDPAALGEVLTRALELYPRPSGSTREALVNFARYVAYAEVAPFEASPIELHSMASAFTGKTPHAIGAIVGFAAGGGLDGGWCLLISVPTGIFLCSLAAGLGPEASNIVGELLRRFVNLPREGAQ